MRWLAQLRGWILGKFQDRSLGQRGEDVAVGFLKRLGYVIIERDYDSPLGELDIIAVDGRVVVFVEVKTRSSTEAGHPSDAIDSIKQQRMTQSALAFLKSKRLLNHQARFDVIAITWPEGLRQPSIEHFANAFAPVGSGQFHR